MAVRANQRRISDTEYENTYEKIYVYITDKIKRSPMRHSKYLGEPFLNVMNKAYKDIMQMTTLYNSGKAKSIERLRLCFTVCEDFVEIITFSYVYWNLSSQKNGIKYVAPHSREYWTNLINKEIILIYGVMKKCNAFKNVEEKEVMKIPYMRAYSNEDIKKVDFLKKLYKVQCIIYRQAIQSSKKFNDAQMEILVDLSRSALYNAVSANRINVKDDEKKFKKREKYFSEAIGNLYAMNRPVKLLSFDCVFSEKDLAIICRYINECAKIIRSIKESDKRRFLNT